MSIGERSGTRADLAAFSACVILSLTALALPAALREPLAAAIRSTVLQPFLALQHSAALSAEYRRSMESLRVQRDSLALAASTVPSLEEENGRLRRMLGLAQRLGSGFVPAQVLHQSGVGDGLTLVLSAGRAEGVEELAPVVSPQGLVGLVHRADRHTSVALVWTHPDFRASAMVEGEPVFGIVGPHRGERVGEVMELTGVAYRDRVGPGALVVTSGLGGVFPRGIPLGTVQRVLSESAGWQRTYLLRPAVHPAEATHVMVLTRARAAESLEPVFSAPPRGAEEAPEDGAGAGQGRGGVP